MLTFDSVRIRLEREQPLTFLEFNYMILQAYDFLSCRGGHGLRLQLGGSDQWGNIVNGSSWPPDRRDRSLRRHHPADHHADGAKMGKTAQGAVWLNEEQLSPTITGSSGGTPRIRTSASSCACSPTCR
jgi:tyrosyl-tRNA synthetase